MTYVTELSVDGENIQLLLPSSVSPQDKEKLLRERTQSDMRTAKASDDLPGGFSLELSVEMHSDIRRIACVTHAVEVKVKGNKGVVRWANEVRWRKRNEHGKCAI